MIGDRMIRRDILTNPERLNSFDWFNDAKDTIAWLKIMAAIHKDDKPPEHMTVMRRATYIDIPTIAPLIAERMEDWWRNPHDWVQVSTCLNGPHVWQCRKCMEWTRSVLAPNTHADFIDPDNGEKYSSGGTKCCGGK